MILCLTLTFVVLVAISMPIAYAMGIAVSVALLCFSDIPIVAIPHKMVTGIDGGCGRGPRCN